MEQDPFSPRRYVDDVGPLLAGVLGADLRSARPTQVTYRPGRSITVGFDADLGGAGRVRVVVAARRRALPGAEVVAEDEHGNTVHVFRAAGDPALPGLAAALDPARVAALFESLGIGGRGAVDLRFRAHRPLRRAVVEATGPGGRLFLKVVRPADVAALDARHRLLEDHVPVPRTVGWSEDGILVLQALGAGTLRDALLGGGALPGLDGITGLLDRLPAALADLPGAAAPWTRVGEHAGLLAVLVPALGPRLDAVADGIAAVVDRCPAPEVGPAHNDLHDGQLVVGGGEVRGVLDVDTAGAGTRVDDLANALGHLSVLGLARPSSPCRALGRRWISAIDGDGRFEPAALRARVAATVLGLATGCFRVQERDWPAGTEARVALAEAWLASAERVLTRGSRAAHAGG